jgi:hypothetical protein
LMPFSRTGRLTGFTFLMTGLRVFLAMMMSPRYCASQRDAGCR